jgi:hypothetical protein
VNPIPIPEFVCAVAIFFLKKIAHAERAHIGRAQGQQQRAPRRASRRNWHGPHSQRRRLSLVESLVLGALQ